MKQSYLCQCDLQHGEHSVLKSERVAHNFALQQLKAHQDSDVVGAIVGAMEALSMTKKSPDSSLVDVMNALTVTDEVKIDSLSDLVTAITLTDEGPNVTEQPSKLWSSRSQFQVSKDPQLPARMNNIPYSEVEHSVHAILQNEQPFLDPAVDPPPPPPSAHPFASTAPLAASKSFPLHSSADTSLPSPPAPPATPKSFSSRSSTARPWQRSGLPRPDAFTPPGKPVSAWVRKSLDIIAQIEKEILEIEGTLFLPDGFDDGDTAQVVQMRVLLDAAAAHVDSAGRSLKLIQRTEQEVVDHKQRVISLLKATDTRISVLGAALPPPPPEATPAFFDATHVYNNPVGKLDTIAQITILLGVVCNVIMGLSTEPCNFIIGVVTLLVKMAMATRLTKGADGVEEYDGNQRHILDQLPTSLYTALKSFKLDGQTTMYAVCPACNCTHKPSYDRTTAIASYPARCTNHIAGATGSSICHAALLEERNGHPRPIKTYLVASFTDYLAQLLSNAEIERLCDKACDDAMDALNMPHDLVVKNVFGADFLKTFEGPMPGQLFIDRGNKARLAFVIQTDFFHPNGSRRRGNHDSIGIISLANLSLPESIRYEPEHMFLAGIIPGPREPETDEISHFLRPIIDECVIAWKPGIRISKTASCPEGRDVEVAIVILVNDLPAARKVSGTAGVRAGFHCTVCSNHGDGLLYNSDFDKWKLRDATEMRRQAEAFRDAETSKAKQVIFDTYSVRWSEFWRLPYWNPTRMLVIDSMHCILEGLVHYHCRHVLGLDAQQARVKRQLNPAFSYPWIQYSPDVPMEYRIRQDNEKDHISDLHKALTLPLNSGLNSITEDELRTKLLSKKLLPLKFVCYTLGLRMEVAHEQNGAIPAKTKRDFADLLINWRHNMPLTTGNDLHLPQTMTPTTLDHIQRVIKDTVTPSWINSVPMNYGESSAGTIKADEWRILSTVYLPIALVTLWGEENGAPREDGSHFLNVLDHTMALFQAVTIACRYTMTAGRATAYRNFIKQWVDDLYKTHPHTTKHQRRQNVHAAFHLYDFLRLFGPVISWWCFPFERLIGTLQKINTNDHIGGELEGTILKSYMRGANLRRWLKRPDCPEIIQQFKRLFNKAFSSTNVQDENIKQNASKSKQHEHAHHTYDGVVFSRSSTHLGNSLVLYYPTLSSTTPIAGSIQKIMTSEDEVHFLIKRQAKLPRSKFDPFRRYTTFPATVYSSKMEDGPDDRVCPQSVLSHVARFEFSGERAVIVNLSRV